MKTAKQHNAELTGDIEFIPAQTNPKIQNVEVLHAIKVFTEEDLKKLLERILIFEREEGPDFSFITVVDKDTIVLEFEKIGIYRKTKD